MARIDYSFVTDRPPEAVQALFVRDIAPELARDRDFEIAREAPGELVFTQGSAAGSDASADLEESPAELQDRGSTDMPFGGDPENVTQHRENMWASPDALTDVLARHLRVEFAPDGAGTRVRIHGHVERDLHHSLELLGTDKHWPETADLPHD